MRDPATTTGPSYPETEPDSDPTPTEPGAPDTPRTPSPPEEMPFLEPKHYPIHPDIPVQPIHETDPTRDTPSPSTPSWP